MKRLILTIGFSMTALLATNILIGQSYFNGANAPVVIGDINTVTTNGNILEVEAINSPGNREQIASFGVNGLMNTDVLEIRNSTNANGTYSPTINGFRSSTNGSALYMIASCNPANDVGTTPLMSWDSRTYTNYFNGAIGPAGAGTVNTRDIFAWRNNQNILMVMDANGQLGINAANPTARLHTNGTLRHQNLPNSNTLSQVLVTDGNGNVFERNVPGLGSTGILNTCSNVGFLPLTSNATGDLACSQVLDNGNRVGINTTTPSGRFHVVENNANTNSTSSHFNFQATSGAGTNNAVLFNISSGRGDGNTSNLFRISNASGDAVTVRGNRNVGVNATNPTARFHTDGTLRHQNLPNSNTLSQVLVTDGNGNVFERNVPGLGSTGILNTCSNVGFLPLTSNATGDLACSQVLDNGNRVGINTTTPSGRFHVVENNANTNSTSSHFNFQATSGAGTNDAMLFNISSGRGDGNTSNLFRISNASGDAVTVRGNRNVGVNATNPTARLHTNGTLRHQNLPNSNTLSQVLVTDGNGNVFERNVPGLGSPGISSTCSSTNFVPKTSGVSGDLACSQIQDNGTTVGLGGISGTYTTGGTTYNLKQYVNGHSHIDGNQWITSDMRYKEDIIKIESAMTLINKINGYEYNLNQDMYEDKNFGNEKTYGVIAQEIEKVIPELVATNQEGFKSVNYNAMIPFLIEALKEQQKEINELKGILGETGKRNMNPYDKSESERFILKQNFPNPARTITSISYDLKDQFEKAEIIITNIEGSVVRNYELKDARGIIEVEVDQLGKVGMYAYSLVINGKIMATKKMIFSK